MDRKEIEKCCCLDKGELAYYTEAGLLGDTKECSDNDMLCLALICSLKKAGFISEEIRGFFLENKEGQVRILKKQRCRMMCDIHEQQQGIDKLDYLIREIKEKEEE